MSDLQGMIEQEAAENVFLQYRHHKRHWQRFRGKPVRSLRRHVRRFTKFRRRFSGKGFSNFGGRSGGGFGSGKGARHRTYAVSKDDVTAYINHKGKGRSRPTTGTCHGRKTNPRGRDGQIMKCRICQ